MHDKLSDNLNDINIEIQWFKAILDTRFKLYFQQECEYEHIVECKPPSLSAEKSIYAQFIQHYSLSFPERILLVLALIPHIQPHILDLFFTKNQKFDRPFTEFGGVMTKGYHGFIPTGETFVFLLGSSDIESRFLALELLDQNHFFSRHDILKLIPAVEYEPKLSGAITLNESFITYLSSGYLKPPDFSPRFPARRIQTELEWSALVLPQGTLDQIREITRWIEHGQTLMNDWGMKPKLRPGYRSLFFGPPGTGKTMTACLLGKVTAHEVYKVDLSMVVSKYIGETEKNLRSIFEQAEHKNWILFFDEADALFGKRTDVQDSHDRYANQEVSYLLQRIEYFNGIIILASNIKDNLDDAFTRRFESMIYFPMPNTEGRYKIWQQGFSAQSELEERVDLREIARQYELSGGAIMNVIRYASLLALERKTHIIQAEDLIQGIRKEYAKEGRSV